jgi:hypothetical protein
MSGLERARLGPFIREWPKALKPIRYKSLSRSHHVELEQSKQWFAFAKFFLGTFAVGVVTLVANHQIQERELEIAGIRRPLSGAYSTRNAQFPGILS